MEVKHFVTLYLTAQQVTAIPAMQGDGVRLVVASLMEGADPWEVPEGTNVGVGYTLPDKTEGYYDRLDSGEPAAMAAGNLVSVVLAPALTQQAGTVKLSLILRQGERQIATFPLQLRVQKAAGRVMGENVAVQRDGFDGKIYYGGPGGTLIPLGLGGGVRVEAQEDGTVVLVGEGGSGGGLSEETDPTVPQWAKEPQKPAYTATEVGALPDTTKIPAKTSDLSNDSGFITNAVADLANYYTKTQTAELIAQIPRFRVAVVQQLPAAGEELILYLVPFATAEGQYLEYIWVDGAWEVIGSQQVDLAGYATQEWVRTGYQPKGHYLTEETLDSAVEDALMEAQESGKFDGADGRGIKSVVRTSGNGAAGTVDTYTITYTDNTTSTFQVRNGANGKDGAQGPQGDPGRTPVKGEDYFTADDIAAMVQATVEALPQYAGEVTYV